MNGIEKITQLIQSEAQTEIDGVLARLANKAFTDKAPVNVVAGARENAARLQEQLALQVAQQTYSVVHQSNLFDYI